MIQRFNGLREAIRRNYLRAGVVAVSALPVLAHAQGDDPFTTAMTNATAKVESYASALVGLAAVAVIFMIGVKYVKKIVRAA